MRAAVRVGQLLLTGVLGTAALLGLGAVSANAAQHASSEPFVLVYVVEQYHGGGPENLSEIAGRFLGGVDGAARILQVNTGVRQTDGGSLSATGPLRPGWVLVMPASATGPGLQIGQAPMPPTIQPTAPDLLPWVLGGVIVLIVLLAAAALWWFAWRPRRAAMALAPPALLGDRDWWLVDRVVRVMLAGCRTAGLRPAAPYLLAIGAERVTLSLSSPRSNAPTPFRASETGTEWYADVRDVQDAAVDPAEPNPLHTLVTVGEVDGELLVLDLALAGGVVQVEGDVGGRRSLIADWGRQLRNAPWADASLPVVVSGLVAGAVPESEYADSLGPITDRITAGGPLVLLMDDLDRRDQSVLDLVVAAPGAPRAIVVGGSCSDARWTITVRAGGGVHSDLFGSRGGAAPEPLADMTVTRKREETNQ